MIQCKHCNEEKPESAMKLRGGKPSKVCTVCDEKAKAERERIRKIADDARSARRGPKKKSVAKRVKVAVEELQLIVPGGGLGFNAFETDDGRLQITQENDGEEADNIVLTKSEARQIFDLFGNWAAAS